MGQPNTAIVRRPFVITLVVAQVICVAIGLSFQHNYIASSVQQSLEQAARSELASSAQHAAEAINAANGHSSGKPVNEKTVRTLLTRAAQGHRCSLALADANWQVTATAEQGEATTKFDNVVWARSSAAGQSQGEPIRGSIKTQTGQHAAVAYPLTAIPGYVLAHRNVTSDSIPAANVRSILWAATSITMLWACGLMGVTLYMVTTYFQGRQHHKRKETDGDALKQAQALLRTQETVIFGLAKLSDSRDPETGDHLDRISYYSTMLASALRAHPDFCDTITASYVHLIGISSALHDIGKVGVEDAILRKPASLTPEERARMEEHTRVGEECLMEIERRLGTSNFLLMAREIASSHHERWNGTGYPQGLAGEHIPLAARIVALADVYDALSSKRVYKEALPHDVCVSMIAEETGQHFDPRIVEVFLKMEGKFEQVSRQLGVLRPSTAAPAAENLAGASHGGTCVDINSIVSIAREN